MLSAMLPVFLLATSLLAAAAQSQNTYCAGCDPCSTHNFAIQAFANGQTGQIVVSNTNTQNAQSLYNVWISTDGTPNTVTILTCSPNTGSTGITLSTPANAFASATGPRNANLLVCSWTPSGAGTVPVVALQLGRIGVAGAFCATNAVTVNPGPFVPPAAPAQPANTQQLQQAATAGIKAMAPCTNLGSPVTPAIQVSVANPGVVIDTTAATVTATLTITNNGPTALTSYLPIMLNIGNTQGVSSAYPCNLANPAAGPLAVGAPVTCTVSVAGFSLNLQSRGLSGVMVTLGGSAQAGVVSGAFCAADLLGNGGVVRVMQQQAPAAAASSQPQQAQMTAQQAGMIMATQQQAAGGSMMAATVQPQQLMQPATTGQAPAITSTTTSMQQQQQPPYTGGAPIQWPSRRFGPFGFELSRFGH